MSSLAGGWNRSSPERLEHAGVFSSGSKTSKSAGRVKNEMKNERSVLNKRSSPIFTKIWISHAARKVAARHVVRAAAAIGRPKLV